MSQTRNGPPAAISAPDLWTEIAASARAHRLVPFPRKRADGTPFGDIAMQVLTQEESKAVTTSTEAFVRKMLKSNEALAQNGEPSIGYATLFENRASEEILFRAARRAGDVNRSFFPAIEEIGRRLTTDEIGVLMFEYRRVQTEIGPIVARLSQEELDAWIERLATGGSAFPLDFLSLGAQSDLLMYMAKRLWISRTDSSSAGGPPAEST